MPNMRDYIAYWDVKEFAPLNEELSLKWHSIRHFYRAYIWL